MRIDCAYFFEAMLHDLPMLRNQPYAAQMFVKRSARRTLEIRQHLD